MLEQIFLHQKQYSLTLRRQDLDFRLDALQTLEDLIVTSQPEIIAALYQDFKKSEMESLLSEIQPVLNEIHLCKKNLERWMKPNAAPDAHGLPSTKSFIHFEPKGVCLIISAWNYPFQLAINPLIGALAAGNCVVLKPSEVAPATSALIARLLKSKFPEEHVRVIEGGPELTDKLLSLPFDHIFFTGSSVVGKTVMAAASKHLSSVTLELGGKSPTIVDSSASVAQSAEKIAWGKFLNAGQTCVAPDYVFIQEEVYEEFVTALKQKLEQFHGPAEKSCQDLTHIISRHHFERLQAMFDDAVAKGAKVLWGGHHDKHELYFSPTVLTSVDLYSTLMKDEIFGPLLPLFVYRELNEVIHFINDRPKPLALYIFSHSEITIERLMNETSSGRVCINDVIIQQSSSGLPFGGVGASGQGNYHGYYSFRAFSHEKPVLRQGWFGGFLRQIYPPYTSFKMKVVKKMTHLN